MHSSLAQAPVARVHLEHIWSNLCNHRRPEIYTARTHAPALCNQCDPKCNANNVSTHTVLPARQVSLLPYITNPGCDPPPLPLFLSTEFCRTGIAQLVTCHL